MRPRSSISPTPAGRPWVLWLCLLVSLLTATANAAIVEHVRHWTAPDHTRVVLDLDAPAAYEVRRVGDPERLAINVRGAVFADTATIPVGDGIVLRIRRNALRGRAQVVLDLTGHHRFRHFRLPAEGGRPDRIVVDVFRPGDRTTQRDTAATAPTGGRAVGTVTVVIDPGHGGLDPGAIRHGVREKDVTLAIARELARVLSAQPGVRTVLTRKGDYFVSLAERVRIAKRAQGDLFVSIHANTHRRSAVRGMEVYFLSLERATDQEAQALADAENAADLVGLPPSKRVTSNVLEILMDLRMSRILAQSQNLADAVLGAARRSPELGARQVKQAGFQVLRSLVMPSVLVETAYLTNSKDRRLLASRSGQRHIARVLATGIAAYLGGQQPMTSSGGEWTSRYRVRAGDTLWELARDHGTTVKTIKERNRLRSDRIRKGQILYLP